MIKHFLLLLLVLAQTLYAAAGLEAAEIPPKPPKQYTPKPTPTQGNGDKIRLGD